MRGSYLSLRVSLLGRPSNTMPTLRGFSLQCHAACHELAGRGPEPLLKNEAAAARMLSLLLQPHLMCQ